MQLNKRFAKAPIFALSLLALAIAATVEAQEAPPKAALCNSCHGPNGGKPIAPNYPKIQGQNKEYLVGALKAYKKSERKSAMAAVMTGQAAALSDEDIETLASYYSGL